MVELCVEEQREQEEDVVSMLGLGFRMGEIYAHVLANALRYRSYRWGKRYAVESLLRKIYANPPVKDMCNLRHTICVTVEEQAELLSCLSDYFEDYPWAPQESGRYDPY